MAEAIPFLSLENVTARHFHQVLFQKLFFSINKGEHWAVVGENDSSKSDLLKTIAGGFNLTAGRIHHHYYEEYVREQQPEDPYFNYRRLQALVSHWHNFRNLSNTTEFYYQQRYNSFDSEDAPTVQQHLEEQLTNGLTGFWTYPKVIETFKLAGLEQKQLIKLSNGETKRLLLAAAVLRNPPLLLLDQPLIGLDVRTRREFSQIIEKIVASGMTILMATSANEIPEAITHVAVVQKGKIISKLTRKAFHPQEKPEPVVLPPAQKLKELLALHPPKHFNDIFRMENISVKYGDKQILEGINWQVKAGERWALLGPNGAGKTTLLSLINGDNPQAYANNLILFDRKRGSGESIWEIKKNIGFVSPELYQYFPSDHSCLEVVESGFYDTPGLFQKRNAQNSATALGWMNLLGCEGAAEKLFNFVPLSVQRLSLLARALVKNPPLLILDEPCQGLEQEQQQNFKRILETICAETHTALIYVTHYPNEIPDCVSHYLRLQDGKMAVE